MLVENDKCKEMQIDARRSVVQLPPPPPKNTPPLRDTCADGKVNGTIGENFRPLSLSSEPRSIRGIRIGRHPFDAQFEG